MPLAWTSATPNPIYPNRTWCGAGQVGSKLYISGGTTNGLDWPAVAPTLQIYDMATDTWTTGASSPTYAAYGQYATQAPVIGTKVYFVGNGIVFEYDTVGNSWQYWTGGGAGHFPACVVVGTDIYIAGGYNNQGVTGFRKFNTVTHVFTPLPAIPIGWDGGGSYASTVLPFDSDNFRFLGGIRGTGNAGNDWGLRYHWNYKVSTDTWDTTTYAQIPDELDNPYLAGGSGYKTVGTSGAAGNRVGNSMFLIAGYYTTVVGSKHNRIYNTITDTWSTGLAKPNGHNVQPVGYYLNKLYCIGSGVNDVYQFLDVPSAPINGRALGRIQKNILSWEDPAWVAGITYRIYWSYVPGVTTGDTRIETGSAALTYEHIGLTNFITVYYRVAAYNAAYDYESNLSNEFSGTPSAGGVDGRVIW